jgi:purine-binding chemotaxis protein CheW
MDKATNAVDTDQQVVIFRLGTSSYAVDIAAVNTIILPQPITVVPQAPPFVVGVINLRSSIVPVLDLRARCGLPSAEETKDSRIMVVQVEDQSIGLQVDAVSEVLVLPADCISPSAGLIRGASHEQLLKGVARLDDRLIMLLDLSKAVDTTIRVGDAEASGAVA